MATSAATTVTAPLTAPVAVEVDHVTKRYGVTTALNDVSLTIGAGEVHGLIGRNGAGKSTLVRIITGSEQPDGGTVTYFGAPSSGGTAAQRRSLVGTVQQRAPMVPHLTVAENIFLGRHPGSGAGRVSWRRTMSQARDLLEEWGISADPRQLVADVGVEARGLIQIARVLSQGSRIVLLDEPTVQLDRHATGRLFEHVRSMRERGITFVFVSHFLDEVAEICDAATVLRDGKVLWSRGAHDITKKDLVDAVLGDSSVTAARTTRRDLADGSPPALEVDGLSDSADAFRGVSFSVAPGELVAIAGLAGSGKNELGAVLAGERRSSSGQVHVAGAPRRIRSVRDAQRAGIASVPPDRHHSGYVPALDVSENMTMSVPQRVGRWGFVSPRRRRRVAEELIQQVTLVPALPDLAVQGLSGGNQQKVVFARALATGPQVLILSSPTAGVDIAAKDVIYELVRQSLDRGVGVVMISDDLDEIHVASRVLVMFRGEVVAELEDPNESQVVRAMEGMEQDA